jgi:dihydrofolate reductase
VITVIEHVTLDGVMQAPAGSQEDTRGGFDRGGWAAPYQDEVMMRRMGPATGAGGGLLLGRRTYEHFFSVWPKRTDGNPFTPVLNAATKYVVSGTLSEPLPWENSVLLREPQAPPDDVVVLGSGELVQGLLARGLVDRLLLAIHPLVVGSGRRLFPDGGAPATLRLVDSEVTTKGVVFAEYARA